MDGPSSFNLGSPEKMQLPQEKVEDAGEVLSEIAKETERVDSATFKPEEVIEREGDYKQAEEIEQAFVTAIEVPPEFSVQEPPEIQKVQIETKSQTDRPSVDAVAEPTVKSVQEKAQTTAADVKVVGPEVTAESLIPPEAQAVKAKIQLGEVKETQTKTFTAEQSVLRSKVDERPATTLQSSDVSTSLEQPDIEGPLSSVGVDPRRGDIGYQGKIEPDNMAGVIQDRDLGGFDVNLKDGGLSDGKLEDGILSGPGKFTGMDSLTGPTDNILDSEEGTEFGRGSVTPLNKQEDLSTGWGGADPRLSAEGEDTGSSGTSTAGTGTTETGSSGTNTTDTSGGEGDSSSGDTPDTGDSGSDSWSGSQEWTDKTDSEGNLEITGREVYDDGKSIITIETMHSGGETKQVVTSTDKLSGAVTSETSTMSSRNPEDTSGEDIDFTDGGKIPTLPGSESINQPLTADTLKQYADPDDTVSSIHQKPPLSFEDAMKTQLDPVIRYTEDHVDITMPEAKPGDVDRTLTDPPKPELGSAEATENKT